VRRPPVDVTLLVNDRDLPFPERFRPSLEEPDRSADTPAETLASARANGGPAASSGAVVRSGRRLCPASDRRSFGVQVSILGDTRSRRQPDPGLEMITLRSTAPRRGKVPACRWSARRGQRVTAASGLSSGHPRASRAFPHRPAGPSAPFRPAGRWPGCLQRIGRSTSAQPRALPRRTGRSALLRRVPAAARRAGPEQPCADPGGRCARSSRAYAYSGSIEPQVGRDDRSGPSEGRDGPRAGPQPARAPGCRPAPRRPLDR
jgi:hypothetical protein